MWTCGTISVLKCRMAKLVGRPNFFTRWSQKRRSGQEISRCDTLVFTREFGRRKTILGFGKCLHFTNVFGSLYIIMYGSCGSQGSIVQSTVFCRRRGAFFGGNLRSNDACQTARRVLITISCATGIYISRHRRIL